ncbi:PEP-CTERM sorting domain-containing protein [Verrucomicrobiaceae bacterium 227]
MKIDKKLLATLASGVATCIAPAVTITADAGDSEVSSTGGVGQGTRGFFYAGTYYAGNGLAPVFPFLLPTLGAGESFDSATLTLGLERLFNGNNLTSNGDIIGLDRVDASPLPLGEDWGSAGTMLHDNFYTPTNAPAVQTSQDFASWLNTQYADGANAGNYVFIKVDAESQTAGRAAYVLASSENTTLQTPELNYTTTSVPEPSSTLLFGLGGLALILRRRK